MSRLYRTLVRPALFAHDSEEMHNRTLRALARVSRSAVLCELLDFFFNAPLLPVEQFGLKFANPLGLAAGMDKFAAALPVWSALGFGFTELGGVTWHPQPGNPAPRMFRAVADQALVNRMGFNNPGAEAMAQKLAEWRALGRWPRHPVGINLGKSKITPLEKAPEDYANSFRVLRSQADFFVVNVSSPNTPNLRRLQDKAALDEILAAIQEIQTPNAKTQSPHAPGQPATTGQSRDRQGEAREGAARQGAARQDADSPPARPVLVKVAPDLSFEALDEILELVGTRQIAGLVATNTTIARPVSNNPDLQRIYAEAGGLSGRPLAKRSTEIVRHLHRQTRGALPIIAVGGIFNAADAWEKIEAGASLLQVYTGLIYEGPSVARDVVSGLITRLHATGLTELRQVAPIKAAS